MLENPRTSILQTLHIPYNIQRIFRKMKHSYIHTNLQSIEDYLVVGRKFMEQIVSVVNKDMQGDFKSHSTAQAPHKTNP